MKFIICVFLGQFIIFFNHHTFVSAVPLVGRNVRQAQPGEYNFVVSLTRIEPENPNSDRDHFCTGIIITRQDILTSDHCLEGEILSTVQIVIGTIDQPNGSLSYPLWWQTHDQWAITNNITLHFDMNDIANIRINRLESSTLAPVRLSSMLNTELYGAEVVIVSWRQINEHGFPNNIQFGNLKVLKNSRCETKIEKLSNRRVFLDVRLICTFAKPHILLDYGDSGGPLLFRNRLIGINKGTTPNVNNTNYTKQVNIHLGIEFYKIFINFMKNN